MIKHGINALLVTLFCTTFITLIFMWGVGGGKRELSIPEASAHHGGDGAKEASPTPVDMKLPPIKSTPGAPTPVAIVETPEPVPTAAAAVPTATPTAAAAAVKVDDPTYAKAASQPGYAEVAALGKNPIAASGPDAGKAVFGKNCASCHGDAGLGDGPAGMALDPKPRNLTASAEYKYGTGDLAVFRTIKYGVEGSGMAPWNGRMSDDESWQVVNFVKTLQK